MLHLVVVLDQVAAEVAEQRLGKALRGNKAEKYIYMYVEICIVLRAVRICVHISVYTCITICYRCYICYIYIYTYIHIYIHTLVAI